MNMRDTMTDMTDHVEVMRDEQVRHARLLLDLQQQIEDASLMGYPKPYEPITFQIPACVGWPLPIARTR